MQTEFAKELKLWRGKLLQREAAALLGVSSRTYEAWERGAHEPSAKPSMADIKRRMDETRGNTVKV